MEKYIGKYELFGRTIVYDFKLGYGGLGDYIKFLMILLTHCINTDTKLLCLINNIEIEKFIKLKYSKMYISIDDLRTCKNVRVVRPQELYSAETYEFSMRVSDVFYFTDEVRINSDKILQCKKPYISIHLRLGDKFLETDCRFVLCKNDMRQFSEENIHKFIEENSHVNIFFCCDNNAYKLKMKEKYPQLFITNCIIGHTSLSNTTRDQVLDSVTELYILSMSDQIACGSLSGFSLVASKFNNIPVVMLT